MLGCNFLAFQLIKRIISSQVSWGVLPIFAWQNSEIRRFFLDPVIILVVTAYAIVDFWEIQLGTKNPKRLKANAEKARSGANVR